MKKFAFVLVAVLALSGDALGQEAVPTDVEIMAKQIVALRAQLDLEQSILRKREDQWAEYSKPLWDAPKMQSQAAPNKDEGDK